MKLPGNDIILPEGVALTGAIVCIFRELKETGKYSAILLYTIQYLILNKTIIYEIVKNIY